MQFLCQSWCMALAASCAIVPDLWRLSAGHPGVLDEHRLLSVRNSAAP
jgi:hypothetical protein